MENPKITSLEQLKAWNEQNKSIMQTPLPEVLGWFLTWFFDLLDNDKIEEAKDGYQTIQESTAICSEGASMSQAKADVDSNLRYWNEVRTSGRTSEGEITVVKKDQKQKLIDLGVSYVTI